MDTLDKLLSWVAINSHATNKMGCEQMLSALEKSFSSLGGTAKRISLTDPYSDCLSIRKRPDAPLQVLLGGHYDTVFLPTSPFQQPQVIDSSRICGPGITDMKGGLMVLLQALKLVEASPHASSIGWEVLVTSEEELGSPASHTLWEQRAAHFSFGLLFEPKTEEGKWVGARKGSYNYTCTIEGIAAHAGRDFAKGASANYALAELVSRCEKLNHSERSVNVGVMNGGSANNIVSDHAECHLNARSNHPADLQQLDKELERIVQEVEKRPGIKVKKSCTSKRAPKPYDEKTAQLFRELVEVAKPLGIDVAWQSSGGVCDGNTLAAAGLPTIDTMGVLGGGIHTEREYLFTDSLMTQAQLTAAYLIEKGKHES